MKLEVGKKYNRRDGGVSGKITAITGSGFRDHYKFMDDDTSVVYGADGSYWETSRESPKDLISEHIKQPADARGEVVDEYGPWMDYGSIPEEQGKHYDYAYYADSILPMLIRVKKEPDVLEHSVYFNGRVFLNGQALVLGSDKTCRNAIITTKGNDIDIDWAE